MDKEVEKINELSLSYREMADKPIEWIAMDRAVNRIAAKMVIPYPPGIPLLMPGEKITSERIQLIRNYLQGKNARFQGGDEQFKAGKVAIFSHSLLITTCPSAIIILQNVQSTEGVKCEGYL